MLCEFSLLSDSGCDTVSTRRCKRTFSCQTPELGNALLEGEVVNVVVIGQGELFTLFELKPRPSLFSGGSSHCPIIVNN